MKPQGRTYWQTLEELAASPAFAELVEQQVPRFRDVITAFDRRRFLQLMAASIALGGLSGCGPEPSARQMLPYVEIPEGVVPGKDRYYATAFNQEGYATGVLVAHQMGRPIKVEGNPDHPASLGSASTIIQASILSLYDPRRSQSILGNGQLQSWDAFVAALYARRGHLIPRHGDGLRILTGTITSPSLASQIANLQKQFPSARWHQWEPLNRDSERAAAQRLFGRTVDYRFDVASADIIFGVESDLISSVPGALAYAHAFATRRRPVESGGAMSRIYAIESTPTLLGAKADHHLPMTPAEIGSALRYIAGAVGAGPGDWVQSTTPHASWLSAVAEDLKNAQGRALVHCGREQPAENHLLANLINNTIGAFGKTIHPIEPVAAGITPMQQSLAELVADAKAGKVDTLFILDTNPVYTAPSDLEFVNALRRIPFSVNLSLYEDETALASTWHVPLAHDYESWSDARAFDGTITLQQPQVRTLYGGHSAQQLLALIMGNTSPDDYALLRLYWQTRAEQEKRGDFETFWHNSLRSGVVANTASAPAAVTANTSIAAGLPAPRKPSGIQLLFRPDEGNRDGRYAHNPWLLEMPRTFTRLTWDNAALIAPATAARLGFKSQDVVEIASAHGRLKAPVLILPGQAENCITLPLGWGRSAGGLGVGAGFIAYPLRTAAAPWVTAATSLNKTNETYRLATTQERDRVEGRDLIRETSLEKFKANPQAVAAEEKPESLYEPFPYPGRAWAMTIDLNACIGCLACAIACQAENNVPVVGKDQVLAGRAMHWLRIDRYYAGSANAPDTAFEPMPCMHCENAPCEVVCPVHATVHDSEGLNLMVYNRCVGTRFCSNNCPYKVRRFNFFAYAHKDERVPESWNPDVTVRGRGVMEKCTYCIQRIRKAEIDADKENRALHDGEVRTACQQSCPTQAITFGDKNDPKSAVAKQKKSPLDYVLLDELNTRPRTSYDAIVRNPNPAIKDTPS